MLYVEAKVYCKVIFKLELRLWCIVAKYIRLITARKKTEKYALQVSYGVEHSFRAMEEIHMKHLAIGLTHKMKKKRHFNQI